MKLRQGIKGGGMEQMAGVRKSRYDCWAKEGE